MWVNVRGMYVCVVSVCGGLVFLIGILSTPLLLFVAILCVKGGQIIGYNELGV